MLNTTITGLVYCILYAVYPAHVAARIVGLYRPPAWEWKLVYWVEARKWSSQPG
ncbi:hypothetical protein ACFLX9_04400 [Chloroflexota bacterium]